MGDVVVCPNCGAKNRVAQAPSGQVPACGRCGQALPWLVTTRDISFEQDLNAAVPVLVDFWAEWCGPCRMVAPVLEEVAREQAGKIKVAKLNVDENPVVSQRFRVQSIPTLILFRNGQVADTIVGALGKGPLLARLRPHLA
jgi:thioredoxin 2